MTKDKVLILLKSDETDNLEFKSSFNNEAIETVCAFTNTKGGKLIIGVNNKKNITGIKLGKETAQNWINEIKNKTSPSVIPDIDISKINNKTIALITVDEFPIKPVAVKGKYFKRVKNSNHQLNLTEITNLHLKTFNTSWDYYISENYGIDDISIDKINKFINLANLNKDIKIEDNPLKILNKYELLKENNITNACYLLFSNKDVFQATIELGRFSDNTTIKDSITIRTDIFTEVDEIIKFIIKHINKAYIITGKPQREELWDYPLDAIREIVINMIVHRDYMQSGDSIVKIFNNRIEFFNPGNLPVNISEKDLLTGKYISNARNKQIATIFKEAGIIEKYGSGIQRVLEAFEEYNLEIPEFSNFQHGFRVIVQKEKTTPITTPITTPKKTLSDKIIEIIRNNTQITRKEIADNLNISLNTVKEYIIKLKKQNLLKRIGNNRSGHWDVIEKNNNN